VPHRIKAYMARYVWRRTTAAVALPQRLGYLVATVRLLFSRLDTFTIRFILASGSVLWAIGVFHWNGDPFERHGYEVLRAIAPSWLWGVMFMIHAAGVTWRLIELKERPYWHTAINYFGFCLWTVTTLASNISLGYYFPGSGMEIAMVLMSGFALAQTGLRKEPVTL
jgi:hypothetical protein